MPSEKNFSPSREAPSKASCELVLGQRDAEALAAAAARGLDGDREADLVVGDAQRVLERVDRLGRAGDDRHAGGLHQLARLGLGAHRVDGRRGRADEDDSRLVAGAGEGGVLGQEAIARMDGLGAGLLADLDDLVDLQVALGGRRPTEQVGLVGALHVQRIPIELGVDGDGGDAHLFERPHDADGDLAPICDQNLGEHAARKAI